MRGRSDPTPDDPLARANGRLIEGRLKLKKVEALTASGEATVEETLLWTVRHAMYWFSNVCLTRCLTQMTEFANGL